MSVLLIIFGIISISIDSVSVFAMSPGTYTLVESPGLVVFPISSVTSSLPSALTVVTIVLPLNSFLNLSNIISSSGPISQDELFPSAGLPRVKPL